MSPYQVILSQDGETDLQKYIDYILFEYKAPLTALRHYEGLFDVLNSLKHRPESFAIQTSPFFLRFGSNVRRINYKKIAIIYTVHNSTVYIHRIIPASLIPNL